jgi:hypothetical protein
MGKWDPYGDEKRGTSKRLQVEPYTFRKDAFGIKMRASGQWPLGRDPFTTRYKLVYYDLDVTRPGHGKIFSNSHLIWCAAYHESCRTISCEFCREIIRKFWYVLCHYFWRTFYLAFDTSIDVSNRDRSVATTFDTNMIGHIAASLTQLYMNGGAELDAIVDAQFDVKNFW